MRYRLLSCAAVVIFASTRALADLPTTAEWLGVTEAFASRCAQLDPAHADKYSAHVRSLLASGTTQPQLAEFRKMPDYKKAYSALMEELSKAPPEQVVKEGCPTFLDTHN